MKKSIIFKGFFVAACFSIFSQAFCPVFRTSVRHWPALAKRFKKLPPKSLLLFDVDRVLNKEGFSEPFKAYPFAMDQIKRLMANGHTVGIVTARGFEALRFSSDHDPLPIENPGRRLLDVFKEHGVEPNFLSGVGQDQPFVLDDGVTIFRGSVHSGGKLKGPVITRVRKELSDLDREHYLDPFKNVFFVDDTEEQNVSVTEEFEKHENFGPDGHSFTAIHLKDVEPGMVEKYLPAAIVFCAFFFVGKSVYGLVISEDGHGE